MKTSKIPLRPLLILCVLVASGVLRAQSRPVIEVPMTYSPARAEQERFGPSAMRLAPDGTFWIVDPVDNTLTNVDREQRVLRQFHLDAAGIADLHFDEAGEMTVLDAGAESPALLAVSSDGSIRERRDLPVAKAGARRASDGDEDHELQPVSMSLESNGPSESDGWRIRAGTDAEPHAEIVSGATRIAVKARRGVMRGVRVLRETADGIYVLAEEVADGETIVVDATVRNYARSGELRSIGRIDIAGDYAYVANPAAVANDGKVYVLHTKPGSALITELAMTDSIPEILPEPHRPRAMSQSAPVAATEYTPAITRDQMIANALVYLNNSLYYPQSALTGYCPGRTAPRYLGTVPRWQWSVAYDWGGNDTVADYNRLLGAGYVAGDINDAAEESCSRGVDCSGYVTRVWGLTAKKSSCTLSEVSTQISLQSLLKGDILTKCGVHVAMYGGASSNGLYTYEATTYGNIDRAVYLNTFWSRFSGYTPRRYVNVSGGSTTPVTSTPSHVRSEVSPASGAVGMTAAFSSTWANTDGTPMTARMSLLTPWGSVYDYIMNFSSGQTTTGALFNIALTFQSAGQYGYAITVTSTTTGRSARYPASGYLNGPYVNNVSYNVSPGYWVCGQSPVTVRVAAWMQTSTTVRFSVTKGNSWCGANGSFIANGVVDLRADSPWGAIVGSTQYYAGAPQVIVDYTPAFTWGSRQFYATIRNQGYWAGPITISVR